MGSVTKLCTRIAVFTAVLAGVVALASPPAAAAETVKLQRSIPFAPNSPVPAAVRDQCALQTKLPEFVQVAAGSSVELVDGTLDRRRGRVLEMEITEVHAPGGGAFSGPKWMSVKGELFSNGKSIGSFRAKRFSTGGAFGGFKGTCAIIGRCSKTLGQDIATWLGSPTANAQLGDAQ